MFQKIKEPINLLQFFLLISACLVLQTNRSLIFDETIHNIIILYLYLFLIIFFQYIILFLIKNNLIFFYLLISFLTFNFLTLFLYISIKILILPNIYKLLLIPLFTFGSIFLVLKLCSLRIFNLYLKIFFLAILSFNIFSTVNNLYKNYFYNDSNNSISFENINFKFKHFKNIHFFYFDSLTNNSELYKKFEIEEIEYNKFLEENFFVFKNSYADAIPTNPSLNSLFFLDPDMEEWLEKKNKFNFFNGIENSPLVNIFRNNGYKIATGSDYGSTVKGKFVDFDSGKLFNEKIFLQSPLFCNFRGKSKFLIFFSICGFYDQSTSNLNIIENLKFYSKKNMWLTVNFLLYPAHAPFNYNHLDENQKKDFKNNYLQRSETALIFMKQILKYILEYDKDSILVILGDHGLITSIKEKINFNGTQNYLSDIYLDRNSIQIAIFDQGFCKKYYQDYNYMTPSKIMNLIISCLSSKDLNLNDQGLIFDTLGFMDNPKFTPKKLNILKKDLLN